METHVGTRGTYKPQTERPPSSQEIQTQALITAKYLDSPTGSVIVQVQFIFLFIRGTRVIIPELYIYMQTQEEHTNPGQKGPSQPEDSNLELHASYLPIAISG